jgi:hypothetical protein
LQIPVTFTEIIANHTVHDERAVCIHGGGEDFTAGKVAPFVARNDPAGLKPFELRREFRFQFSPVRRAAGDAFGLSGALDQALAEFIHFRKIGAHSFQHDFAVDIDHVPMPDAVIIDHAGHLRPSGKLTGLRLRGEDRHLRECQIIQNDFRHVLERTPRMMLQHKQTVVRTDPLYLLLERRCDFARRGVGDHCDPLLRFQSKTNVNRVARAGEQLRINRMKISAVGHEKFSELR